MKETIPQIKQSIIDYVTKPGNGAGGSLHILLEDGNVDDKSVAFCIQWAEERGDDDGRALAERLMKMTKTQRGKIASLWSSWIGGSR